MTNTGTIGGGVGSVAFAGTGANTLTLGTGSTLNGGAYGSKASGATNALVLQGSGTANNNFTNFNTLTADASGTWTLGGNSSFGDTTVSTGTLSVTGSLTSKTLEIQASARLTDAGDVSVDGSVTNSGNLTINGVTMHVAGAGGTFTEKAGGTTTLLNGGVLDPPNIVIDGGDFRGSGSMAGNVTMTGGTVQPGAVGGSLKVEGGYSQTGGEIVFDIDPNGRGGFLETTLVFDPSFSVGISDTTFVYRFPQRRQRERVRRRRSSQPQYVLRTERRRPILHGTQLRNRPAGHQLRRQRRPDDHGIRSRDRSPGVNRRPRTRHMGAHDGRIARPRRTWAQTTSSNRARSDGQNRLLRRPCASRPLRLID